MKLTRLITLLAAGAALALNSAFADGIDYSSSGGLLKLNGNSTFTFTSSLQDVQTGPGITNAQANFNVTNDTLAGDAYIPGDPLKGLMSGTFSIGTPVTVGLTTSATVSGTGTFKIYDGLTPFTANLSWVDISQTGSGSTLNVQGVANLTSITYAGSRVTLIDLKNAASGASNTLTFQFVGPTLSLTQMLTSTRSTSFSGSVSALPDGGETLMLLGLGLSALAFIRRKQRA
jgi:hypothetical protein